MTTVYFIRHAQADNSIREGAIRPLTPKGMQDRAMVTEFLRDKRIDAVFSSPFRRAVDTIADFADKNSLPIQHVTDFRERKGDSDLPKDHIDFPSFLKRQWEDFTYTYSDGECLAAVQKRNIVALNRILLDCKDQTIVIGTHGTSLSTIIRYYDPAFGFDDFCAIADLLPWVVEMSFAGTACVAIQPINLFFGVQSE